MTISTAPFGPVAALAPRPEAAAPADRDAGLLRRAERGVRTGSTDFNSVLADEAGTGASRDARSARDEQDVHEARDVREMRGSNGRRGVDPQRDRGHDAEHAVGRARHAREAAPARDGEATAAGHDDAADGTTRATAGATAGAGAASPAEGTTTGPRATDDQGDDAPAAPGPTVLNAPNDVAALLAAAVSAPVQATDPVTHHATDGAPARVRDPQASTPAVPGMPAVETAVGEPATPAVSAGAVTTTAASASAGTTTAMAQAAAGSTAALAQAAADISGTRAAADTAGAQADAGPNPDPAAGADAAAGTRRATANAAGGASGRTSGPGRTTARITAPAPAGQAVGAQPMVAESTNTTAPATHVAAAAPATPATPASAPVPAGRQAAAAATPAVPATVATLAAPGRGAAADPAVMPAADGDGALAVAAPTPTGRVAAAPEEDQGDRGRSRSVARAAAGTAAAASAQQATTAAAAADALAGATAVSAVDEAAGSVAALDVPAAAGPADRVVAEAIGRIRTAVHAGVPGLESRIEDPQLGSIRVLVSGRPGEVIHAELIARDPATARELTAAIERAFAGGATLPTGVDLQVRTDTTHRPSAADAHLGGGAHGGGRTNADGRAPEQRQDGAPSFAFGQDGGARSESRPETQANGRERHPGPAQVARAATTTAGRSGAALDVRA